jgi:hypothetical protein
MVWVYAQEVSEKKQLHWHWVVFIPRGLQETFRRLFRGWIVQQIGTTGPLPRRAINYKRGWFGIGLLRYLLKEGTDEVRQEYWVPASMERTGGIVEGKRIGISRSLQQLAHSPVRGTLNELIH